MSISLILLAGGTGTRMQSAIPKQFLELGGKPLSLYSYEIFLQLPEIQEIIVVAPLQWRHLFPEVKKFALPGLRRQDSVYNGLQEVDEKHEWVITHDSARPFITSEMVKNLISEGKKTGAATLGVPLKPTIKEQTSDQHILRTLERASLVEIQTPQILRKETLQKGFSYADHYSLTVTDDTSFAELLGLPVKVVPGGYSNLKITTPEDIQIAEYQLLKKTCV